MKPALPLPPDYSDWLASLKSRIQGARQRALLAANAEQIRLYHDIGREILDRQSRQGWGAKVIDQVSSDLRAAFPAMKGLSATNLKYMRFFAEHCPDRQFVQQSAAQFPQTPIGQQSADPLPTTPIRPTLSDHLPWFQIPAPTVRSIPAQGIALGNRDESIPSPERAIQNAAAALN
jgi:hypothetical protein